MNERTRTFSELLIDAEEHPATRGLVIGMLREGEMGGYGSSPRRVLPMVEPTDRLPDRGRPSPSVPP